MTSPRNTPRFGRWSSGETPPSLDADDCQVCYKFGRGPCKKHAVSWSTLFSDLADGYAVDEEDEDE